LYAYLCVFAHSRFVENPPIWSWETKPLIFEVVLSQALTTQSTSTQNKAQHATASTHSLLSLLACACCTQHSISQSEKDKPWPRTTEWAPSPREDQLSLALISRCQIWRLAWGSGAGPSPIYCGRWWPMPDGIHGQRSQSSSAYCWPTPDGIHDEYSVSFISPHFMPNVFLFDWSIFGTIPVPILLFSHSYCSAM
jgi:hypothetical protein